MKRLSFDDTHNQWIDKKDIVQKIIPIHPKMIVIIFYFLFSFFNRTTFKFVLINKF
jgi:hypothetical protein